MEQFFKKESEMDGKYVSVTYIEYEPANVVIKTWLDSNNVWTQNNEEADKLIDTVLMFRTMVSDLIKERGLSYDVTRVLAEKIKSIEAWTSPICVISKLSKNEMTKHIVESFHDTYTTDKQVLTEVLEEVKSKGGIPYLPNFSKLDNYKRKNEYWEFGLESLESYFTKDPLDKLGELLSETLDFIKKANENNE